MNSAAQRSLRASLGACALAIIGVSACGDTQAKGFAGGPLEIVFSGQIGSEAFACGEVYEDVGVTRSRVLGQDLRFYVSALRLLTADGTEVAVELEDKAPWQTSQVALLDFEDGTGACEATGNPGTNDRIVGTVPRGEYVGIAFSVSVPEALNHADPFSAPAPLQVTAMQWSWLLGYKFLRAEVRPLPHEHTEGAGGAMHEAAGMDGGAAAGGAGPAAHPPGHPLDSQFHLGSLGCANQGGDVAEGPTSSCSLPNRNEIVLERFDPSAHVIVADLAEMMRKVDLSVTNHCHGAPGPACTNFYAAVGLDSTTGQPRVGQTAFRVQAR